MENLINKLDDMKVDLNNISFDDDIELDRVLNKIRLYIQKLDPNDFITQQINESLFRSNQIRDVMFGSNENQFRIEWENGKKKVINIIDTFIEGFKIESLNTKNSFDNDIVKNEENVFIIHGKDEAMKETVARVVSQMGLNPIILHEQIDEGRTIIDKFENFAKESGYAIALLSPDDICKSADGEIKRARQNVIFELGYFTALLVRKRTFVLVKYKEELDLLSDYQGVVYKEFDSNGAWKYKLVKELRALGYSVSADDIS